MMAFDFKEVSKYLDGLRRLEKDAELSTLDLQDAKKYLDGPTWTPEAEKTRKDDSVPYISGWHDSVKWPDESKMPKFFNPKFILRTAKRPAFVSGLHTKGKTGKNVSIAIIDQRLNLGHPEYKDRIKRYEIIKNDWFSDGWHKESDYHGSLVVGVAAGKTTGVAPDADIYYVAANNWISPDEDKILSKKKELTETEKKRKKFGTNERHIEAVGKIIQINRDLPPEKKIRFLSCSFNGARPDKSEELQKMFEQAEEEGIMVLVVGYGHTGENDNPNFSSFDKRYNKSDYAKVKIPVFDNRIYVPTDGKTNPFFKGGYMYERLGGVSSTLPYLAGVFALALQDNILFAQQKDWQDKIMRIAMSTATEREDGMRIINPAGIVDAVAEQTRKLQLEIGMNKKKGAISD